jgi:hypothetical protein
MMKTTLQQRIPSRRQREATLSFRCKVGLTAAVCAATCVAAFTVPAMRPKSFALVERGSTFSASAPPRAVLRFAGNAEETPAQGDDAEWKALVAAFQMYKAAYGDLKVPSRFIVPSMPPWPGPFFVLCCAVLCCI